jgi:D-hexose-6-phosphate mutarotase
MCRISGVARRQPWRVGEIASHAPAVLAAVRLAQEASSIKVSSPGDPRRNSPMSDSAT